MKNVSLKAIIIGGLVDFLGSAVTAILLGIIYGIAYTKIGIPREQIQITLKHSSSLITLGYFFGGIVSIIAGYVAATVAKKNEIINGIASSSFGIVYSIILTFRDFNVPKHFLNIAVGIALGFLGGYLRIRVKAWRQNNILKNPDYKAQKMFKNLGNLAIKRSLKQAFGFYIGYLFLLTIIFFLVGLIVNIIFPGLEQIELIRYGTVSGIFFCLFLSTKIIWDKRLYNNYSSILMAIVSGILASLIGSLGGLIPAAYLTTRTAVPKKPGVEDAK